MYNFQITYSYSTMTTLRPSSKLSTNQPEISNSLDYLPENDRAHEGQTFVLQRAD